MKRNLLRSFPLAAGLAMATGLAGVALAQDQVVTDMATLNQIASKLDPEDYAFVQPVCTRCHTPSFFLHSRTWSEWQDIFHQMSGYGAQGTDEQWDHIHKYFQRNLTQINVNHADEDELSAVLGVDDKTAIALVQHRVDKKFASVEELEAVPGVNKGLIEAIKPRIMFEEPSDDQ
jgi:hypothetical protein